METTIEKTTEILNDLIIINNDRFQGYQKAIEQVEDNDLKDFFSFYSNQSKRYNAELRSGGTVSEEMPAPGETTLS